MRREGRTTTPSLTPAGSSSHARRAPTDAQAALLLACEILHYRPVYDLYEEWLARITELVSAAGGSPAPPSRCLALRQVRATWLRSASTTSAPRRRPGSKACGPWK